MSTIAPGSHREELAVLGRVMRLTASLTIALTLISGTLALASATYNDTISGVEYAATSTVGSFAGTASGDLPGTFDTQVVHTPLSPDATITGGSFTLYTTIAGSAATVDGAFASGTVVQTDKNSDNACKDQHYAVNGTLQNVGVNGAVTGTGIFNATLTHYRIRLGGRCVTYFATIAGSVSLIF